MWIPGWFVIAIIVFIALLLVRLAQLYSHLEELRDTVMKLEGTSPEEEKEEMKHGDSGGS